MKLTEKEVALIYQLLDEGGFDEVSLMIDACKDFEMDKKEIKQFIIKFRDGDKWEADEWKEYNL